MIKKLSRWSFLLILLFTVNAFAQSNGDAVKTKPFKVGETLIYEGKFSKIIRGLAIADLSFTLTNAPNSDDYLVKAEARSKGTLLKLFRFSFLQKIDSTIDADDFRALKTVKRDIQKDRVRDSEAVFNYGEKRVTYIETDPKEPMRPPRKMASSIEEKTHDLVSAIYSLRLLPLAVGKSFDVLVSDSGFVYKVPVRVTAREQQKTIFGKIWCFRIEPEVFGENRLVEQKGSMIIWIADDERRIPVRSQLNTEIGRVEVKLKRVS